MSYNNIVSKGLVNRIREPNFGANLLQSSRIRAEGARCPGGAGDWRVACACGSRKIILERDVNIARCEPCVVINLVLRVRANRT